MAELIYPDESYAIVGGCFEVYKDKGCGFLEAVYQECLEIEFEYQHIPCFVCFVGRIDTILSGDLLNHATPSQSA